MQVQFPGLGRSPGEGKNYPLQYSDLENSMGSIVYGVAKNWTGLSNFNFHLTISATQEALNETKTVTEINWELEMCYNNNKHQ